MAKFTVIFVIWALFACMEVFTGEALVKVKALVSLGTPGYQIKLAELPHLGWLCIM